MTAAVNGGHYVTMFVMSRRPETANVSYAHHYAALWLTGLSPITAP